METIYYRDSQGKYIGGFSEGNESIPEGAIEVSTAPNHFDDIYTEGIGWVVTAERQINELKKLLDEIEKKDTSLRAIREILMQVMVYFASLQSVSEANLYAANPAYKGLKDLNVIASNLRTQIRNLS